MTDEKKKKPSNIITPKDDSGFIKPLPDLKDGTEIVKGYKIIKKVNTEDEK